MSDVSPVSLPLVFDVGVQGKLPGVSSLPAPDLALLTAQVEQKVREVADALAAGDASLVPVGRGRFEIAGGPEAGEMLREIAAAETGVSQSPTVEESYLLFSGIGNQRFATQVARHLDTQVAPLTYQQFKDGESSVKVLANVRDREVYVIAGTSQPVNDAVMETCILIDALKRASAGRITLLMPYYGYGRQDRKTLDREPITASLVAKLLEASGVNRVVTVDLHAEQTLGFFNVGVDNLYASAVLLPVLRERFQGEDLAVVSPDAGGVKRARAYARDLGASLVMIDKRRDRPNEVAEMTVIGDVEGKACLIVDDMVDTGGTLIEGAQKLIDAGARSVSACVAHPVLSGDAVERLRASPIREFITTDSIPLRRASEGLFTVVPLAPLFAAAIARLNNRESLSELKKGALHAPKRA